MFRTAFVLPALCLWFWSAAQAPLPISLPLALVADEAVRYPGYAVWRSDSLPLVGSRSLAERLQFESAALLRANAPGGLHTLSLRGAGPARSAVVWEGVNLQSPMNGVLDLSLIPFWPDDQVRIQYGGQSAALSAGAMGGSLHLAPGMAEGAGREGSLSLGAGSFGRRQASGALRVGASRYSGVLRGAYVQADNDFPFVNRSIVGRPTMRQPNNRQQNADIQHYGLWRWRNGGSWRQAIWLHDSDRQIPPAMTESPAVTWQRDRSLRAVSSLNLPVGARSYVQFRVAWIDEAIAFHLRGQTDWSRSRTFVAHPEWVRVSRFAEWRLGAQAQRAEARADGYAQREQWFSQWRAAAYASARRRMRDLSVQASARWEYAEGQAKGIWTWALGADWKGLQTHLARNFNLPTLNDRFWRDLGNPDLLPERGYSASARYVYRRGAWRAGGGVFHLLVDDWILWQPGRDGLFRPGNLRRVWSRGLEAELAYRGRVGEGAWNAGAGMQYLAATNRAVYNAAPQALGKDLPYTPRWQASASGSYVHGALSLGYAHQWTGRRYTLSDNSASLPAFSTGHIYATYGLNKYKILLSLRVENCWNRAFESIAFRPMPGRAWHVGVGWRFARAPNS
ncbi:MAG: TonB-dependent receptor domain-containing protein [Saprospiraceae bacterium]